MFFVCVCVCVLYCSEIQVRAKGLSNAPFPMVSINVFYKVMIRFFVTNHSLEMTLFLLYIVNAYLMLVTVVIFSSRTLKENTITICLKKMCLCAVFSCVFPHRRKWSGHFSFFLFCFLCGISETAGWASGKLCKRRKMISCSLLEKKCILNIFVGARSAERENIQQLWVQNCKSVCMTAWCGCELYCMYICAYIHVGICVCVYMYVW